MAKWLKRIIYLGAVLALTTPLLLDNSFFFPFISTKVFFFRIVVEIMLLAYLLLNVVSTEYRLKGSFMTILVALFIAIAAIASALGGNFYQSFWGDIERGEGIILWLHLLALLVILTSVVREERAWAGLFDFSLLVAILLALFGFGQALGIESLLATSGERVDATLGNAAFFGAYLLIHVMMALYLFKFRRSLGLRIYYLVLVAAFAILIPMTQTRGAFLGLAAGILFGAALFLWRSREKKAVRYGSIAVILFVLATGTILYLSRSEPWVQENGALRRMASISLREKTAQTRLLAWSAAWKGWQEKFVLGWGVDNYDVVFNKNFPPALYEDLGSVVWYDRAHNVIFDRGVTTGILGLTAFLLIFLYPGYRFFRLALVDREHSYYGVLFSAFVVAYLIQDLFIFESVAIYVVLFFVLAFWSALYLPPLEWRFLGFLQNRKVQIGVFVVYLLAFFPIVYAVNLHPAKVNRQAAASIRSDPKSEDFFLIVERFKKTIEGETYGYPEYVLQFIDFVGQQVAGLGELLPEGKSVVFYADEQVARLLLADPDDAKNYLLAMRHYNYTYQMDLETKMARLEKALSFYPGAVELSPTRPQIHQEAGYSHFYLYREYRKRGDLENMDRTFASAEEMFRKTIELSPRVIESYGNLLELYLAGGQDMKIEELLEEMRQRKISIRSEALLTRLADKSLESDQPKWRDYFLQELIELRAAAGNVEGLIELAVYYARLGERERAIEISERIRSFGGDYEKQVDMFIENVNRGGYEIK